MCSNEYNTSLGVPYMDFLETALEYYCVIDCIAVHFLTMM